VRAAGLGSGSAPLLRGLARPATPADRRRQWLVAAAVAGCGVFLLSAFAILMVTDQTAAGGAGYGNPGQALSPYLAQSGLRGGTAFGAVLLVVPFGLLAVQALRTGTAARERRLAALSLAGATRGQMRRIAVWEGTRAAALGGLAAAPAYLLLWLVVGVALPNGARLLPSPTPELALAWAASVALLAACGALSAMLAARPASVTPLGIARRAPRPLGRSRLPVLAGALGTAVVGGFWLSGPSSRSGIGLLMIIGASLLLCGFGGAPLVRVVARRAARGDLVSAMAAHRLLADVRTPGRVAGVLLGVGFVFGAVLSVGASVLLELPFGDTPFHLTGLALVALGALLACVVAMSSLMVAATEQVLDGRRGIAVLVALAASPDVVLRVVRRQLVLTAVPATVVGAAIGALFPTANAVTVEVYLATTALCFAIALVVAGGVALAAAAVAARAVRPAVREASRVENLRAP
jgi:hypothetical protein